MPGRTAESGGGYRFGFNGHEKIDEIAGSGNLLAFGDYGLDTRLGRRLNIDPQWQRLPGQSSYSVNNNSPIQYTDPDGEFGFLGAAIGAVVGAAAELGGQVVGNLVQGKPAFEKIDWADVAISAGEGALAGVTGGVSLLASGGFEAAKASIDYTQEEGFSDVIGLTSDNRKDIGQAGIDFAGGLIGLGAGKVLPSGDFVKDAIADQFVKNGIKSEGRFLTGMVVSDLAGGLIDEVQSGTIGGLYKIGVDALQKQTETKSVSSGGYLYSVPATKTKDGYEVSSDAIYTPVGDHGTLKEVVIEEKKD